jgi:hypothetical protein
MAMESMRFRHRIVMIIPPLIGSGAVWHLTRSWIYNAIMINRHGVFIWLILKKKYSSDKL